MVRRPPLVAATLILITISAFVWLTLGVIIAAGAHPAIPDVPLVRTLMAVGSLAAAAVLAVIVILLARRIRIGYWMGVAALTTSSVVIFFDDVGWTDLIFLALCLIPLFLLLRDRTWYLRRETGFASPPSSR